MKWPIEKVTGHQWSEWRYRHRHKRWCTHVNMTSWYIVNSGRNRYRVCPSCERWEWV